MLDVCLGEDPEPEKLVQLYYQDLVTVDVFQREQHKLKAESKAAQRLRSIAAVQGQRVEQALQLALDRLESIHEAYLDATPLERRMMNRAIFTHIEIGNDGDITKSTLTPPYDAISAWQPTLGRPAAAVAAQAPAAPQKPQVRPSSGYAGIKCRRRLITTSKAARPSTSRTTRPAMAR